MMYAENLLEIFTGPPTLGGYILIIIGSSPTWEAWFLIVFVIYICVPFFKRSILILDLRQTSEMLRVKRKLRLCLHRACTLSASQVGNMHLLYTCNVRC